MMLEYARCVLGGTTSRFCNPLVEPLRGLHMKGIVARTLPRELRTERLHLRRWLPSDRAPFAALNADPQVMEHFPAPLSCEDSDACAARIETHFEQHGFGLWAVEIPNIAAFAGFIGLSVPSFDAPFTPCVEIG